MNRSVRALLMLSLAAGFLLEARSEVLTYSTTANGDWTNAAMWKIGVNPANRIPVATDDVIIPGSRTVNLADTAEVASLIIQGGALLNIGGTNANILWRQATNYNRTEPVGLTIAGNVLLNGGNLAIGGLNQKCPSFLTVGGNLTISNTINNASLTLYAGFTGETNDVDTYKTGGARVTVAGSTYIGGTHATYFSTINPFCHQKSGAPVVFDLQDLTIGERGRFDATGRGFSISNNGSTIYYGPGAGKANSGGGGYGGLGGGNPTNAAGPVYGYAFAPFFPGSPGRQSEVQNGTGGGAIRIRARNVQLDGALMADGNPFWMGVRGAGSGGGIWITCTNFAAGSNALIRARGGDSTDHVLYNVAGGGGGRVAIITGGPSDAELDNLYASGTGNFLMDMPMSQSPYPGLVNVTGGMNYYQTANGITNLYNGADGTAYWLVNKGGDHQVEVTGDPAATTDAYPAYGKSLMAAGIITAGLASPGLVAGSAGGSRMTCTGYAWSNTTDSGSGTETNFSLIVTDDTWLTWTWSGLQHRLEAQSGGYGSISAHDVWHTPGAEVTLTATPATDCMFLYWVGDVAAADRQNPQITLVMDRPRTVTACFAGPADRDLTANASAGGDWFNPATWDGTAIPGPSDRLTLSAVDVRIALPADIMIGQLTLASNAFLHIGGEGTNVLAQAPISTNPADSFALTISGGLTISNTARLALGGQDSAYRSFLQVDGDLLMTNAATLAAFAGYTGPTNDPATFRTGGARVTVNGFTTLTPGAWIHPFCHQKSGAPVVLQWQDAAIAANAGVNASGRGHINLNYDYRYGLGTATSGNTGGSYGGRGGGNLSKLPYGFSFAPYMPGSAGCKSSSLVGRGGGTIRLLAQDITLNGRLLADGLNNAGNDNGAGSGGSVWITCATLTAGTSAYVSARGGDATQHSSCGAGGGGRIAIMTDSPTELQFDSLYATGACDNLIITTTNMADPVESPYPFLANVWGGTNNDTRLNPLSTSHGKPGTAVWLRNKGTSRQVTVSGEPSALSLVTPEYGTGPQPEGDLFCSAVSPVFVADSGDRSRLFCTGYTWSNTTEAGSGEGTNVTLAITDDTWLTWQWGALEQKLTVRSGGYGTVQSGYAQWYTNNAPVTLTAVADEGATFLYWVGDLGGADPSDPVLALTMDRPREVIACFTRPTEQARSLTWGGGVSSDWFDPANWDGAAIPGVYDGVSFTGGQARLLFPADMTVGALSLESNAVLFIGGTGASVTASRPVDPLDNRTYRLAVTGGLTLTGTAALAFGGLNGLTRQELSVGGDLVMGGAAQLAVYAGYSGDVPAWENGGARVTVAGSTLLSGTAWVYPFCHQKSGAPVVFDLKNLSVGTSAGFNASGRGFGRFPRYTPALVFDYYGPGAGHVGGVGGSHGGIGGQNSATSVYGFANAPYMAGSPGADPGSELHTDDGGGVIRILAREVQLDGRLLAVGSAYRIYAGAGSGGSIWVTCDRMITGTNTLLNANGGMPYDYSSCGGGGGGRVAVGVKLSPQQITDLYATGSARGVKAMPMAESPLAGRFSVAPGIANQFPELNNGTAGTAMYLVGSSAGTVIWIY